MDLLRESAVGQILRYVTKNKVLLYPEEKEGFHWAPLEALLAQEEKPTEPEEKAVESESPDQNQQQDNEKGSEDDDNDKDEDIEDPTPFHMASIITHPDNEVTHTRTRGSEIHSVLSRTSTRPYTRERFDVEEGLSAEKTKSIAIAPTKTADGTILVDWYTTDDPANPQNWAASKKGLVLLQLCAYSLSVYGASSMYVPGEQGVMEKFHVGATPAALGLAIYVVGYGVGPLIWAPLSEIASIGRNWVYIPTFFLFVILSIPTAVVDNYAGLLVLRFLTGFFGSPCLANGGASVGDMYSLLLLPVYLSAWTAACFWGPAIGPLIAGFAVQAKGWRWGLWEIVWLTGPILVVFLFAYPETSADNILRRRAQRLRLLTGKTNIKSKSEIDQAHLSVSEILLDALIKPTEIMIKDPAVAFTNIYTSLTYGIYYSFFEVFPLVYPPIYHFNLGETGLCFLTIGIACVIGVSSFNIYQFKYLIPDIKKNGLRAPEHRLVPALFGVILLPMGYFMFGWTARHGVHWIVSLIGVAILVVANFFIFQCVFVYLPLSYPKYAASLFAANDLSRSLFAAACVLFSRPMFINLGVGGGVSLLAGMSCLGVFGMFYLWRYGAWLRSKSTFAVS
ncbi:major facilitator superfamily transporter [Mollisia scopiformis]|uniref:Major facilitator superfamily transporter n=1 Tax=Mollisia scopiformis TaxID=149040 RepID=A0A132B800_MOLSC|nr:major facilitator superfamily transporter [Mollisia scopiformis]KUJ08119.1 major facilitator superfamily transporter [Mollisia scopiformis]